MSKAKGKSPATTKAAVKVAQKQPKIRQQQPLLARPKVNVQPANRSRGGFGQTESFGSLSSTGYDTGGGSNGKVSTILGAPSTDYAMVLADPENAPLAGIPTEFPLAQSQKVRAFVKGTFTIGTAGVGFLQFAPLRALANNVTAGSTSSAAYALATSPVTYVEPGVVNLIANGPYAVGSYSSIAGGLQGRVVGCALKLWYTGTELNLGGEVIALRQPDNETLTGGWSTTTLLSFPTAERIPTTTKRSITTIVHLPTKATEVDYAPCTGVEPLSLLALVTGPAGVTFGFKIHTIYEVIGINAIATTRTHGDPEGFAAVIETAENTESVFSSGFKAIYNSLVAGARDELKDMSGMFNRGVQMAGQHASSYAKAAMLNALSHKISEYRNSQPRTITWRVALEKHKAENKIVEELTMAQIDARVATKVWALIAAEPYLTYKGAGGTFTALYSFRCLPNGEEIYDIRAVASS